MLTMAAAWSLCDDSGLWTLCLSGFVDEVIFSHNGPYGASLEVLAIMSDVDAVLKQVVKSSTYSPGGATLYRRMQCVESLLLLYWIRSARGERDMARQDLRRHVDGCHASPLGATQVSLLLSTPPPVLYGSYGCPMEYFLPCGFFFYLFFPRLISAVAGWMSAILPHVVWP